MLAKVSKIFEENTRDFCRCTRESATNADLYAALDHKKMVSAFVDELAVFAFTRNRRRHPLLVLLAQCLADDVMRDSAEVFTATAEAKTFAEYSDAVVAFRKRVKSALRGFQSL